MNFKLLKFIKFILKLFNLYFLYIIFNLLFIDIFVIKFIFFKDKLNIGIIELILKQFFFIFKFLINYNHHIKSNMNFLNIIFVIMSCFKLI